MTGGVVSVMVTVWCAVAVLSDASVALHCTAVTPTGKLACTEPVAVVTVPVALVVTVMSPIESLSSDTVGICSVTRVRGASASRATLACGVIVGGVVSADPTTSMSLFSASGPYLFGGTISTFRSGGGSRRLASACGDACAMMLPASDDAEV